MLWVICLKLRWIGKYRSRSKAKEIIDNYLLFDCYTSTESLVCFEN